MRGERILGIILATVLVMIALSSLNLTNFIGLSNPGTAMATSHALSLRPNGVGAITQWTGSANATNWQHVNEQVYLTNTADYVYTATNGQRDSYNLQDHTTETWPISNVRVVIYATQPSGDDKITLQLVIGGTAYDGSTYDIGPDWVMLTSDWPQNPSTTAAWQWGQIDTLQAGFKSVQIGPSMTQERVAQLYVQVIRDDWNPSNSNENPCKEFTVNVNITSTDTGVSAWEFKLAFDSTMLYTNTTMIKEATFLKCWVSGPGYYRWVHTSFTVYVTTTYVMVGGAWTEYDPDYMPPGITGSGTAASITFKVVGPGNCSIDLYEDYLYDINLDPISLDVEGDGLFYTNYPKADFTYTPPTPGKNTLMTFNASDSYDPDGTITDYNWNFGDGNTTSSGTNPIIKHKYTTNGTYVINLTITDNSALKDWTIRTATVGWAPQPAFFFSPITPYVELTPVTFNASDSYDPDGTILYYIWDFNDTSPLVNETDPIATHNFVAVPSTIMNVTLTVYDNDGWNTTIEKTIMVGWPGDADGNGFVDVTDFAFLGASWFKGKGETGYDSRVDFDFSDFVDVSDFAVLGAYWFKGAPWYSP